MVVVGESGCDVERSMEEDEVEEEEEEEEEQGREEEERPPNVLERNRGEEHV